jgi:hypothetical protein
MPGAIPRAGGGGVSPAAIPGVRVPTNAPAAAFGVEQPLDLSGLEEHALRIHQRETEKADQVALLGADNQLAAVQSSLHASAVQRHGRDALGATADVTAEWGRKLSDIEGTLGTDQQRLAFRQIAGRRLDALRNAVELHAAQESDQYTRDQTQDGLTNRVVHAVENYTNPAMIAQQVTEAKDIVRTFGAHMGWSAETLQQQATEWTSRIHSAVIDRMLANGQDLAAIAYRQQHAGELSGEWATKADQALEIGSVRGLAQRETDRITATATDMPAALAEAAKIVDPRVRDAVEARTRQHFEDQQTGYRLKQEQLLHQAEGIVRQSGRLDSIPPAMARELDQQSIDLLHRRFESNPTVLNQLRNVVGLQPGEFAKLDLTVYEDQLSKQDYAHLVAQQTSIRLGEHRTEQSSVRMALRAAERHADAYKAAGIPVPSQLAQNIRKMRSQLDQPPALRDPSRPNAPGAPIGLPPMTVAPTDGGPQVPRTWRNHAAANPAYARYLQTMGVDTTARDTTGH